MISKQFAQTKAASIKTTLDDLEEAVEALPTGEAKANVEAQVARLHRKLHHAARRLADFFGDDVETFSGGTDKPDEE